MVSLMRAAAYLNECEGIIVLLLFMTELLFRRMYISGPKVTDGVNAAILQLLSEETEAPPQLLGVT